MTLLPLCWLLTVTVAAGLQKIFHADPRIGFLAQAQTLRQQLPGLEQTLVSARHGADAQAIAIAEKAVRANQSLTFNNLLDAAVAGIFLCLVAAVVLLAVREWLLLLARRRLTVLHETPPVWLPDYAVVESRPLHLLSWLALAVALAKELSGEAQLERATPPTARVCNCATPETIAEPVGLNLIGKGTRQTYRQERQRRYLAATEERFKSIRRCC